MKGEPIPENEADSIFDHFAEMEQAESEQPAEPAEDVSRPGYVDYDSATASDGE